MDLSKLTQNEKLATYGAVAAVIGGIVAAVTYRTYAGAWLGVIGGLAMLAIVFLPQRSPGTSLPGSTGTLMLIAGGVSGVLLVLIFISNLNFTFVQFGVADLLFIVAVVGAAVMAWAGWQAFQAEGGTFRLGSSPAARGPDPESHASAPAASAAPSTPAAPAAPVAPEAPAAPAADEPVAPAAPVADAHAEPARETADDERAPEDRPPA